MMNIAMKHIFKILKFLGIVVLAVILAHGISAVTLDRIIQYKKVTFRSSRLPAELDGYKIAFICDTHALPAEELEKVVRKLNKRQLDLLLLGGDFPSRGGAEKRTMEILSRVETTDGIYGVEGNHDFRSVLFRAMREHGIHSLANSGVHVRERFFLAGLAEFWTRRANVQQAIKNAKPDDFVLLVTHNPDVTMVQDTTGVDLILSGHTHGGQATIFGLWAPYFTFHENITKYGQRFRSGWAKSRDGVPVFVSNGTGAYLPRVFARPQVIVLTLRAK